MPKRDYKHVYGNHARISKKSKMPVISITEIVSKKTQNIKVLFKVSCMISLLLHIQSIKIKILKA